MSTELCHCGCVSREGDAYAWAIEPPLPVASAQKHWLNCHPDEYYEALEEGAPE